MTRTIYCPGIERAISLRAYVRGIKLAKANLDAEFKQGLTCWWPCTGREIIHQFWEGVQQRINDAIPYLQRGQT
ncbi:hypothetical protein LCGC14_0234980 [marine sediment metagenome]|uniref:Uncharacterized protein n=1 Tax=marine sediment metagenome TaxID=412755 RepID=A0A0F9UQ51_9ZZZZ